MTKRRRLPDTNEDAQGMVEFALILPLLLLVVFGVIELGRMLWIYSATLTASREAARYGSAAGSPAGQSIMYFQDCDGIRAAAMRVGSLAGIDPNNVTIYYDSGTTPSTITDQCPIGGTGPGTMTLGNRIGVRVLANYEPIVPLVNLKAVPITAETRRSIIRSVPIIGTPPPPYGPPPDISFQVDASSVDEGVGTAAVVVSLSSAAPTNIPVTFSYGGSATAGSDYTQVFSTNIPSGATGGNLNIPITDDAIDEDSETVIITIETAPGATIVEPDVHTLTIVDNDVEPKVSFQAASSSGDEGIGSVAVSVVLDIASGKTVSVAYAVSGGTAAAGVDYNLPSGVLTFAPGSTLQTILFSIQEDALDEDDETVGILLSSPSNAVIGAIPLHTFYILDNDLPPEVFFAIPTQTGAEIGGALPVQVVLSAPSGRTITVPYNSSGTATLGADYTLSPQLPLTIPPGSTSGTITINVLADDDKTETDETVILTLVNPTNATLGSPSQHIAIITDRTVSFTMESQVVREDVGSATVTMQLNGPHTDEVRVTFSVSGTAQWGGVDYTKTSPAGSEVVIPAGSTTGSLTFSINNDILYEADETIIITMGVTTGAGKIPPSVHTLTIQSDDPMPTVQFSAASQTVYEGDDAVVVASLSAPSGSDVVVAYTLGGTAVGGGTDYTIDPSPLTIPGGVTSAPINVKIIDEIIEEDPETLVITMDAVVGALKGSPNIHTITINDNGNDLPPDVSFTIDQQTTTEGVVGSVSINISLNRQSGKTVTVPFSVAGTATLPDDYSLSPPGGVVIPAGSMNAIVSMSVVDDMIYEVQETVELTLGTPMNANLGAITQHIVKINDNGDPVVCEGVYSLSPPTLFSGSSPQKIQTTLDNGSQVPVEIVGFKMTWKHSSLYAQQIIFGSSTIWETSSTGYVSKFDIDLSDPNWTGTGERILPRESNRLLIFLLYGNETLSELRGIEVKLNNGCNPTFGSP